MIAGGNISDVRGFLAERIAGEITLSQNPGETLRKWRKDFGITQSEISNHLGISPSVISDYESGRRRSPGIQIVRKIVDALLRIDESHGSSIIRAYENMLGESIGLDTLFSLYEYPEPILLSDFTSSIDAALIYGRTDISIYGYTIIDSMKAILELLPYQFSRIFGRSTARALIFMGASSGRSSMVAVRVSNLKPGAVILQGIESSQVDPIAIKIAEVEHIPLLSTTISFEEITSTLNER
jgi:putative transcriptional regulator